MESDSFLLKILIILAQILISTQNFQFQKYIAHRYDANSTYPLIHLTVNNKDGLVYISAVNRLYQLDKDLDISSFIQEVTGPVMDADDCLPYKMDCGELHDNYNKILLMDQDRERIIVCGSVFQGICEARSMQDISQIVANQNCVIGETCNYGFVASDYVACSGKDCSTLGVIAEGPTVFNPVLYVAATVTEGIYRTDKSISTRSLYIDPSKENILFRYAVEAAGKGSFTPNEKSSTKDFKYAFSTDGLDGFVYFLFQKITTKSETSVISRICKKDVFYSSYIEMNLTCPGLSQNKDTQLVGAYYMKNVGKGDFPLTNTSEGVLYVMFKNATGSSLCLFTVQDLNQAFDNTLLACFKYKGQESLDGELIATKIVPEKKNECTFQNWIDPDQTLDDIVIRPDTIELNYYENYTVEKGMIRCGAKYLPTQIKRIPPIVATWSYYHPRANFSAVTVHLVNDKVNVAYIGTTGGDIIELNVNKKEVYNILKVGFPISSDLILDDDSKLDVPHLYVMTPSKVFHVRVSVCKQHTTCSSCLGANDPYCGWCILKSSCMPISSNCPTNSWLEPLSDQCIRASEPEPMERTLMGDVRMKVDLLPVILSGETYECVFDGKDSVAATVDPADGATVTCVAPPSDDLPQSLDGEDFVNVTVSIRYNGQTDIVSTTATFYECLAHGRTLNKLQPCNSCLTSKWEHKCQWCIGTHSCMPQETGTCIVKLESCPQVTMATPESSLLSVGLQYPITMDVLNLPTSGAEYSCVVEIKGEGKWFEVPARRSDSGSQVICERKAYSYTKLETQVPANVTVFWKPGYVVDTKKFDPISFYNCSVNHDDCSLCVTSKPNYNCGWCSVKTQCTTQQMCPDNWITDAVQCPEPQILSFTPSSGPITGLTQVTISGENMGVNSSDVQGVTVADVPCDIQPHLYKISKQIVCMTRSASSKISGKILVTVRNVKKTSAADFNYRNPTLDHLETMAGPASGGTTINIVGTNMNTGYEKLVFVGDTPCEMLSVQDSNTHLQCKTSPSSPSANLTVRVKFDSFNVYLEDAFSYMKDPEITSYSVASAGKLASFLAGGRNIMFVGKRLNLVQDAQLIAYVDITDVSDTVMEQLERTRRSLLSRVVRQIVKKGRMKRSIGPVVRQSSSFCTVANGTHMICPSPKVSLTIGDNITRNISDSMFVRSTLKLVMDNILLPLDGAELKYYPNPVVVDLDEQDQEKEWRNGSLLKIKVLNLNEEAITKSEIKIKIGEQICPVDSMDEVGLLCILPEKPTGQEATFEVTVKMGNKVWQIGTITYFVKPPSISETVKYILIASGVVLTILIVVIVVYLVRKNRHYKENKNEFQKVIENLEMSVRADFRKAFAELSIDMTDLTADIGDVGLPILNYRQYATNMFFPSVRYHPCMKEPDPSEKPIPQVEQGLLQFSLLITNKHFLISFVRTLEEQRNFSNRDKGNVASLITVVLHKKLDYFTEVMKSLITDLISASVQRNPKLVLRRTESVAERMFSNWMAICLFPYIRDNAGKPLFLLQKAIKHQVSKGALDAITGKARYTLSDDRLLKEDVQSDPLTLFVSQSGSHDDEPVIVKVLSCDSISQVKEKVMDAVYKRIPFSHRPKADQLDLEWRHGRSGHLVLPDIDYSSDTASRWKRVMTIKDYKVENNATMALIQRQQDMYGSQDIVSHYTAQTPDTSIVSPMLPEESAKVYHLVKYTDDLEQKRESTIPRDRHKHILDLYLLRLINMKGILQSYVDEVFQAILDTDRIPVAVKHFFDFLDDLAKTEGIEDHEILHIWKTNSVLGRFWVTILKNPESVFDIDKPETVESSMSVISQTFIDACSVQEHKPTKDSPINKQLYAKEIPTYKKLVQKYYQDVQDMQPVSDQDMCAHMAEISRSHNIDFDVHAANNELWGYVNTYYEEIQETLSNDPNTTQMVMQRLHQAYTLIDGSVNNP